MSDKVSPLPHLKLCWDNKMTWFGSRVCAVYDWPVGHVVPPVLSHLVLLLDVGSFRTGFGEAVPDASIHLFCLPGTPGKSWFTGSSIRQISENWTNEQVMLFSLEQHSTYLKNEFGPHSISMNMYCQMYSASIFVNLFVLQILKHLFFWHSQSHFCI